MDDYKKPIQRLIKDLDQDIRALQAEIDRDKKAASPTHHYFRGKHDAKVTTRKILVDILNSNGEMDGTW